MKKKLVMVTEPIWNYVIQQFEVRWKYEGEEKQLKLFNRKEKSHSFTKKLLAENE